MNQVDIDFLLGELNASGLFFFCFFFYQEKQEYGVLDTESMPKKNLTTFWEISLILTRY